MSLKKNMKDIKKGLSGFLKETLDKGKEVAQTAAAGVEQYTTAEGLGKLVRGAVKKGREARDYVQEQGGLVQMAEKAGERTGEVIGDLVFKINEKYSSFEQEFFPDGNLDTARINSTLENATELTQKYGKQAVDRLRELAAKGASAAKVSYRDFSPDKNERQTTYAGIGSKIPFYILTRADGDKCLDFHEEMRNKIEGRPEYKGQMLADIKGYVITDKKALVNFYQENGNKEMTAIAKKLWLASYSKADKKK